MGIKIVRLKLQPRALDDRALVTVAQEKCFGPDLVRRNPMDPDGLKQFAPARHREATRDVAQGCRGRSDMTSFQAGDPAWRGAITGAAHYSALARQ